MEVELTQLPTPPPFGLVSNVGCFYDSETMTRPRTGYVLFFLGLLTLRVFGAEPATGIGGHHSLWKVQGPHSTVYLLGSVHVLKESDYPLPPVIESAFSNATVAVFETEIDAMDQPATQMRMMSKSRLPEGVTLEQELSAKTYQMLQAHAETAGVPMVVLSGIKPVLAVMTLEVLEFQKLGLDPKYGLDQHFFKLARAAGKEVVPLETVDFQLDLITGFSKEESEMLVKATLEDIDNTRKSLAEMLNAWRTGDGDKLEKLLNEVQDEAPVIFKRLVTDRSQSWVPKIMELAKGDKPAIVIVGAGHLVGASGLIDLLRKQGLKVSQD